MHDNGLKHNQLYVSKRLCLSAILANLINHSKIAQKVNGNGRSPGLGRMMNLSSIFPGKNSTKEKTLAPVVDERLFTMFVTPVSS